jgi:hypothetical protein
MYSSRNTVCGFPAPDVRSGSLHEKEAGRGVALWFFSFISFRLFSSAHNKASFGLPFFAIGQRIVIRYVFVNNTRVNRRER